MDYYNALVIILCVTLFTLFSIAAILTFCLLKKRDKTTTIEHELQEHDPLLEKTPSLRQQNKQRLDDLAPAVEDDDVFEDGTTALPDISFSLLHMPVKETLVIDIWSIANTPRDFTRGYVEVQLFPSDFKSGHFRTNEVSSVDSNVVFNKTFTIPYVSSDVLSNVYLKLFLYASNEEENARAQCAGHIVISLRNTRLNLWGKTHLKRKLIQHMVDESPERTPDEVPSTTSSPSPTRDKGQLYISLRYQKSSGRINVVVLKAENIQKGNVLQNDTYVKIRLLHEGEIIEKKQTKAKRRGSSATWNEPFAFNIDEEKGMHLYEILFTVRRRDFISPNACLGHVRIGAQAGGAGQSHWYAMMAKGNLMRQVARSHKIV